MKKAKRNKLVFLENDTYKVVPSKNGKTLLIIFENGECVALSKIYLRSLLLTADKMEYKKKKAS